MTIYDEPDAERHFDKNPPGAAYIKSPFFNNQPAHKGRKNEKDRFQTHIRRCFGRIVCRLCYVGDYRRRRSSWDMDFKWEFVRVSDEHT